MKESQVVPWLAFSNQAECSAPRSTRRVNPGMNGTDRHLVRGSRVNISIIEVTSVETYTTYIKEYQNICHLKDK